MPDLKNVDVRIGTSGYSFEHWRSNFYPDKIEKGKMLDYYIKYFPTVEINSTYYRIPHPAVMANIVKKAPDGFDFMVKVPQSFTHRRTDLDQDVRLFSEALQPMVESRKLSGLLAQFPFSFKFSQNSLDYLSICRDAVNGIPLFVEFRHDSWVNRTMYDYLRAENISYVCVDGPQLRGLLKPDFFTTTSTGYVRLHGRNEEKWWEGGDERYDYLYSKEELLEWRDRLVKAKSRINRLYLFFNNCHLGKAAANALQFEKIISSYA
ncbi:MAG: DUF72 domain-containing protein [bacterium]|nr:DUF72 domain-containing protein [bacterium]